MKEFKKYMDRVHASSELKANTKETVMEVLLSTAPQATGRRSRKYSRAKKMGVAIAAAAACMVVAVTGYAYYETPVDYISLDINPSVELGINAFEKVVRAEGINQDGADLIGNLNLHNMSVEDAVRMLVTQACTQEYVAQDGSTVIALTAQSKTAEQAMALGEESALGAKAALQQQNAFAIMYGGTADLGIRTQAQQMGVSPGKYKLMLALQSMDPAVDLGQLKTMTVSQVMLKAGELAGNADQGGPFAQTIQNMQQTASQVQQRSGTMQQDQDQLMTQDQLQDQMKEQDQTQDQLQDQDRLRDQDGPQASCEPTGSAEQNQNAGDGGPQKEQNDPSPTGSPQSTPQAQPSGSQGSGGSGGGNQ